MNFKMDLREKERKRQPFVAKINEQSLAKATIHKQKQQQMAARRDNMNSLEYAALNEHLMEEEEDQGDDFGLQQTGQSALDMLGEAEKSLDDIQAKMANE